MIIAKHTTARGPARAFGSLLLGSSLALGACLGVYLASSEAGAFTLSGRPDLRQDGLQESPLPQNARADWQERTNPDLLPEYRIYRAELAVDKQMGLLARRQLNARVQHQVLEEVLQHYDAFLESEQRQGVLSAEALDSLEIMVREAQWRAANTAGPSGRVYAGLYKLQARHGLKPRDKAVLVDIASQSLFLYEHGRFARRYDISSGRRGVGTNSGSLQTPLGTHRVRLKIGHRAPVGTVFQSLRQTGYVAERGTFMTTRLIALEGMEHGFNRGANASGRIVDSFGRGIFIHGTPAEQLIGTPVSNGCIRMTNHNVINLFENVQEHTLVEIIPPPETAYYTNDFAALP